MIAAMAAYAFTFFEFRGKEIYFAVILALMVVPIQIAVIPILQLFVWFGNTTGIQIIGQYPAAWIVHATFAMPLAIYILRNYMRRCRTRSSRRRVWMGRVTSRSSGG